jgi:hypothetical protein
MTTTPLPAGAAAAPVSGGGALLFASGGELPDDPPVPPAAAPSAVGGARGRLRGVGPRFVKKGPVVVPNASTRWDSLGSDGVSHHPVLVLPEWYETLAGFFVDFYEALDGIVNLESIDDPVFRRAHDVARRRRDGEVLPEWYETDACYFVDFYEALESIDDPDIRRANDALKKHYALVKKATKDDIPWAEVDKKRYLCGKPQGIVCGHYSPSVEAGPVTNAGMNVHISASEKDGERTRVKQKSVCLRFQSQAIALETAEHHDGYTVVRVVEPVEGVPGAMVERFVAVQNSSAALLHFDVFERWPCVDGNDVDIEGAVRKRLGPDALVEGDNLFANLIQARRLYVAEKFGGEPPPVMVWNRGTTDGVTFGCAQVGTFESLETTCGEEKVSSTYHMAYMMRKSPAMKVAAPYADAAMREFISGARPGALKFPKNRRDGYWAFFHEVAEMTDEERRMMREEFLAFMREIGERGGKTVSDAWEAFKAGKADDAQRAIVEAQMEGSKTVSDAWEAFKAGKADDAQRAIVEAMMEGPRTVWDALEAVRYDFENGTTTATEEQFDIAQRVFAPKMMRRGENPAEIIIWRNKDAALAALEPGTDSGETVADAAFPARAAEPTKTKGAAKLKDPAQGECASEPDAFKFGTIGNACMNLLKNAGADGLSTSTLAQEINELELAKLSGRTTKKNVARSLGKDRRFVRVAPGVFALKDSSSHLFSALAAQDWVREAYLGDGNGDFVPGDGEDDVEFLTEKASLVPLKASGEYKAIFKVYTARAATSPRPLYSDVYKCVRDECEFSTGSGFVRVYLPVGTKTRVSSKVVTFLKSFLFKVRKLTDADVNAKNAVAAAEKKKKAKKAKES